MSDVFSSLAALNSALLNVGATSSTVAARVEADAARISSGLAAIRRESDAVLDTINQLSEQVATGVNEWSEEFQLQLDLIAVGGQRVDEFLVKWGDAVIQTERGAETIREAFNSLDVRGREQEIQQLISGLRRGSEGVQDALDFLANAQGRYADELRKTVEAVLAGKAPIEKLAALIKQIQAQFANTPFEDLAQALEQALRTGGL